jgi:radical SAM superfamily enzyme YgiQ (UPF0313 family)
MKRILLVTLDYDKTVTSNLVSLVSQIVKLPFLSVKAFMAPVGMATVAALTPDDIDVDMWDEAVHGLITEDTHFKEAYDLVAITGYTGHFDRMLQLGQFFRQRGIPVAVGGPGVSASPELYRNAFDILFIGEAEYIWPQFLSDWKAGRRRNEYRQVGAVDMAHSPPPRWDKVAADLKSYMVAGVQTTRGCPFDCEFCDVIYLYGRQQRHKSITQVLREISALERLGVEQELRHLRPTTVGAADLNV